MRLIKNSVLIVFITILLFLACDFILSHIGLNPNYVFKRSIDNEAVGMKHPVYHHDLKQNLDMIDIWGSVKYRLCTNEFGFKVSCNSERESRKNFDFAFIGDSFTESIGTTFEDSFVGLFAQNHPDIAVVNFGVRGYSPSIYFKKIEFLLNSGFTFKHLIVLPDISDIHDEAVNYAYDNTGIFSNIVNKNKDNTNKIISYIDKNSVHNVLMQYFKFTWYMNCIIYDYFDDNAKEKALKKDLERTPAEWTRNIDSQHYGKAGVSGGIRRCLEYTRRLKQLLDKRNIKMTIVVYPWPTQLFFEDREHLGMQIWKDFCIKEDCHNFIDANQFFFDEIQKSSKMEVIEKYYIRGDSHFNEEGNRAMFEIINSYFKL